MYVFHFWVIPMLRYDTYSMFNQGYTENFYKWQRFCPTDLWFQYYQVTCCAQTIAVLVRTPVSLSAVWQPVLRDTRSYSITPCVIEYWIHWLLCCLIKTSRRAGLPRCECQVTWLILSCSSSRCFLFVKSNSVTDVCNKFVFKNDWGWNWCSAVA